MFGWRPGIGDPTTLGWVTVAAYAVAAVLCWLAAGKAPRTERRWWQMLAVVLALLCINKQVDLQTLFTDVGRTVSKNQGWYEDRRPYQYMFVGAILALMLVAAVLMVSRLRRAGAQLKTSMAGLALLAGFIFIRAASLEKIDRLINRQIGTPRVNHWLEIGGIAVIAIGAIWMLRPAPRRARR
jgi:hypothetical protein